MAKGWAVHVKSLVAAVLIAFSAAGCHDSPQPDELRGCVELPPIGALGSAAQSDGDSSARPLWSADYESADLSAFGDTPWNSDPFAPEVTSALARSGSYSGSYTVPPGGSRSESIPTPPLPLKEGEERWFALSSRLDATVPLDTGEWQVFGQWKNEGEGSPPLALYVNDGLWKVGGGWGWPGSNSPTHPMLSERRLGAAVADTWEDWVVHVRFSSDPEMGLVDVWRNGTNLVCGWRPEGGTLYPGRDSYLKVGYYRSPAIGVTSTAYFDDVSVWDESVVGGT